MASLCNVVKSYSADGFSFTGACVIDDTVAVFPGHFSSIFSFSSLLSTLLVALAGGEVIHGLDLFDSALAVSAESTVIANEIAGMVKRIVEGINVNDEKIGFEVIKRVSPGGEYVTDEHTLHHFRKELFFPAVSDRRAREKWLSNGGIDTNERAWNIARKIWDEYKPKQLDDSILRHVKSEFTELVNI